MQEEAAAPNIHVEGANFTRCFLRDMGDHLILIGSIFIAGD